MEFIESERGNQKLKIELNKICGGQLSGGGGGGYCPAGKRARRKNLRHPRDRPVEIFPTGV